MADSTIDSEVIFLKNPWGPSLVRTAPVDVKTLASSYTHNVASPVEFRPGDVINVYNTGLSAGVDGYAQFVYLKAVANAGVALAVKQVCVPDSATDPFVVTNDPDDCITATGAALYGVCISSMTTLYYGWFWCGGVCPEEFVSGLGGTYATEDNVAAGNITVHDLAADAIGFGPAATTEEICGYALVADT